MSVAGQHGGSPESAHSPCAQPGNPDSGPGAPEVWPSVRVTTEPETTPPPLSFNATGPCSTPSSQGPGVKGQGDLQGEWWALCNRYLEKESYVLRQGQDSDPTF